MREFDSLSAFMYRRFRTRSEQVGVGLITKLSDDRVSVGVNSKALRDYVAKYARCLRRMEQDEQDAMAFRAAKSQVLSQPEFTRRSS